MATYSVETKFDEGQYVCSVDQLDVKLVIREVSLEYAQTWCVKYRATSVLNAYSSFWYHESDLKLWIEPEENKEPEKKYPELCFICYYWKKTDEDFGRCHRFPQVVDVDAVFWCGEFKQKDNV